MPDSGGFIEVTAIQESQNLPAGEHKVLIASRSIVSVEKIDTGTEARTRIVVAGGSPTQKPWILRGDGGQEPAETRVFTVTEKYEVVRVLISWARDQLIKSERDYLEAIERATTTDRKVTTVPLLKNITSQARTEQKRPAGRKRSKKQ